MKFLRVLYAFLCASALLSGPAAQSRNPGSPPAQSGIREGCWEGSMTIKRASQSGGTDQGPSASLAAGIRLFLLPEGSGALMDIPEQSMYGYPLDEVGWTSNRISFLFDALGPDEELVFEGLYSSSGGTIIGTARSTSWKGSFRLSRMETVPAPGESDLSVDTGDGRLPGTLLLPSSGQMRVPLVLLLAGAGTSDRNGNNYNVPGKSDSLALLARALAERGVASYRYDKRGSGEAYSLERGGAATSLTKHAEDAARALGLLRGMDGFSRIVVAGMNEGAWIGAAAINLLEKEGKSVDGLVVLDASGEEPIRGLEASLEGLGETTKEEAEAIIEAILAGDSFPVPSAQLADFFSPSRAEWLKSWLGFKPAAEMAKVQTPVLFIYGSEDLQVSRAAFERLLEARPAAAARLIPFMNYALKQVRSEEENYESFTNPAFPIPDALVDLLAAFVKAKPAPGGSLPYEKEGSG